MVITSKENDKVKIWKKLKEKKYRDETNTFIVEGEHLVLEAYKNGYIKELIIENDVLFPLDVETHYVTREIINSISTLDTPSNIIALCSKPPIKPYGNKILVLDNIQDPGNVGTIIRSAVAFNIDTVILSETCADIYNPKCIRATQGMIFYMNVIRTDLLHILPELQNNDYIIYGTKVTHGKNIKTIPHRDKYVIIMGNEGNGITDEVQELCSDFIYIPISEVCESLNVSIACSIILYELGV